MGRKWINIGCFTALMVMVFLMSAAVSWSAEGPPQEGDVFPDLKFPIPEGTDHLAYLGLGSHSGSTFKLGQVKADVVIFEIFSMYCPYCQNEAPSINGLYRRIADGGLEGKIKLVGIGAGNSPFEVDLFRKKFGVSFPLLPDSDLVLHKALGEVRTPYFIAVALGPDGKRRVIYSRVGTIGDPGQFLELILQQADLR